MIQYKIAIKCGVCLGVIALLGATALPVLTSQAQERLRQNKDRSGVPGKPSGRALNRPAARPQPSNTTPLSPSKKPTGNASETVRQPVPSATAIVAAKPLTQNGSDKAFAEKPEASNADPITVATEEERNQVIAPDWERPWACLMLTGRQHGYMEPCGCTGLENQKGGLNRRDTLLTSLRERGWDVLPIDTGDQVRRRGRQSEIKFARTAEAFKRMDYAAVMFGTDELKLSATDLYLALTDPQNGKLSSPFVAANISILSPGAPDSFKIIQIGSKKIGITGVIGDSLINGENGSEAFRSEDIPIAPAVAALKLATSKLKAAECDFLVLIAQASLEESADLARAVPVFDLVVTSGGYGEPYYKPEPIEGTKSVMLQVGVKGMYAGIVGLYDRKNDPIVYQRVALSSQFEDSPRIMELFGSYQKDLEQYSLEGLGLRPRSHPSTREFAGTESCGDCHTTAMEVWKNTPHAHATDSIITPPGRGQVARHFDPECLSCHVTGWNPQEFHPYVSGYSSLQNTPHLVANGCENCHGPGSSHSAAEEEGSGVSTDARDALRVAMRLPLDQAKERCMQCHDLDNSPDFHKEGAFEDYWAEVEHYGLD